MTKRKNPEDKLKAGRPTDYDPKYCGEIIAFMERTSQEIVVDRTFYGSGNAEVSFRRKDPDGFVRGMVKAETHKVFASVFPTLERFAHSIGVHKDTVVEWATAEDAEGNLLHPEFSVAYKRAKQIQESNLIENGLTGQYSSNFAIFVAKNVFGWKDKSETEVTGKDGAPLQQAVIYLPDNRRTADAGTE